MSRFDAYRTRYANVRLTRSPSGVLEVALERHDDGLHLAIEDDGRLRGPLRPGNGLAGMRERIEGEGGRIAFATGTRGALRIDAWLPA